MAYQVLARKWRPQSFSELMGQEHVATTLLNALKSSRMPHALLFTGPRGVGKTSAARILAKSLRCTKAVNFVPCNECDDCVEITAGNAIDVIEIDGASNNGVENVRELRETIGYMPSRGQYKVYIIDEVHMLSTSAFNALLKTLEEPPPHVIFIFATTEAQKIPVTILSRVQRFDFRRIPVRKVVERLKTIIDSEGVTAEPQALWLIGRESEGSMRDSQSLLDQVITFCGKNITHDQVVDVLGLTDRTLLSNSLKALIDRNVSACMDIIEKVFNLGYDPKQFAQDLLHHIRNLMIVKVSEGSRSGAGQMEFLDLPEEEIAELKKFAASLSEEDIHLLFDMTLKGVSDVVRAQDPRIVLEMLLLRLSQAPRLQSIQALLAQLQSGAPVSAMKKAVTSSGGGAGSGVPPLSGGTKTPAQNFSPGPSGVKVAPEPVTPVAVAPPVEVAVVVRAIPTNPQEKWAQLLEDIKKERPLLGAKLEYAAFNGVTETKLSLTFRKEQEFFYSQMTGKDAVAQLNALVAKHWGKAYEISILLGVAGEGKLSPQEEREKQTEAAQAARRVQVEADPLVMETQKLFRAKITSITTVQPVVTPKEEI